MKNSGKFSTRENKFCIYTTVKQGNELNQWTQHISDSLYTVGLHSITVISGHSYETKQIEDQDLHMVNEGMKPYMQEKFVASCCKTRKVKPNPLSQSLFPMIFLDTMGMMGAEVWSQPGEGHHGTLKRRGSLYSKTAQCARQARLRKEEEYKIMACALLHRKIQKCRNRRDCVQERYNSPWSS